MLNEVILTVSKPSWVEIAMLIVTTLYLLATMGVFLSNKKMAKAAEEQIKTASRMAELSKNVDLLEKRSALLEIIKKRNEKQPFFNDSTLLLEFQVLYNDEVLYKLLDQYETSYECLKNAKADRFQYSESMFLSYTDYQELKKRIDDALQGSLLAEDIEAIKKEAGEKAFRYKEFDMAEERYLDLFEISEREYESNESMCRTREILLEKMQLYIRNSITMKSM